MPIGLAILLWTCIAAAWTAATRHFHPTLAVASCVTASLIASYAAAAWINESRLLPQARQTKHARRYWLQLIAAMFILTALALTAIHIIYHVLGPFPTGPIPQHFALDFFGMAVHIAGARAAVAVSRRRHTRARP